MKFATFMKDAKLASAIVTENGVVDIEAAARALGSEVPYTLSDILHAGYDVLPVFDELLNSIPDGAPYILNEATVEFGPASINPQKIVCVGLNYRDHVVEMKLELPGEPLLFGKFANAVAATGQDINVAGLTQVDYEAELAVVIGREACNVSVEDALDFVFGYANANDLSERDLQFRSSQWLIGKTLDGFLPMGPYLVTADEIADPDNLQVRGWLNGELRQDGNTGNMVFSVAEIISYASRYMTLLPGDIIATGTPPGVISGTKDKVWMKSGDTYEVEVAGLGRLTNCLTG